MADFATVSFAAVAPGGTSATVCADVSSTISNGRHATTPVRRAPARTGDKPRLTTRETGNDDGLCVFSKGDQTPWPWCCSS